MREGKRMKKNNVVVGLSLIATVGAMVVFSGLYAKDYQRTDIGDNQAVYTDDSGVPLMGDLFTTFGGLKKSQVNTDSERTMTVSGVTYTYYASDNVYSYFNNNKSAFQAYIDTTSQPYLKNLYNDIYVNKTRKINTDTISRQEYLDLEKQGTVRFYTYYYLDKTSGDIQELFIVPAYLKSKEVKHAFNVYKNALKLNDVNYEDIFILE